MSAHLGADEAEVEFSTSDGWALRGILHRAGGPDCAGVVLVPGSLHERDAFVHGRSLPSELAALGVASLRFDIRGRGASSGRTRYHDMAPLEQDLVRLDIDAAIDALVAQGGTDRARVGVLGEQDTSQAVVAAAAQNDAISAIALLSPRLTPRAAAALGHGRLPILAMVSREDRAALRSATTAYLAGDAATSRLDVFAELGFGTTMFVARAYVQPDEEPIESIVATWFSSRLAPAG